MALKIGLFAIAQDTWYLSRYTREKTAFSLKNSADIPSKWGYKLLFDNYFSSVKLFQENGILKWSLQSTKQMAKLPSGSYKFPSHY